MHTKKRIVVIYDTSFVIEKNQSVKKLIMAQRMFSRPQPGLLGSLLSKVTGKGADQQLMHNPEGLFTVVEVIPAEVAREVQGDPRREAGMKFISDLMADQAIKVSLIMDTVAGVFSPAGGADTDDEPGETDERIVRYAGRMVSPQTNDQYDLALVATADDKIARSLAQLTEEGLNAQVIRPDDLADSQRLRDRLAEMVNEDRADKITIEKPGS
jgi:hypothetical protein